MITKEFKQRVIEAVKTNRQNYNSDTKHAKALGTSASQYSRAFNKGELDKVLDDSKWINIARRLGVQLKEDIPWVTVKTETYEYVYSQLKACQTRSISAILCDIAGIGKTHTAKQYVKENRNAVYIDCSQVKSRQKLIRKIAQEFGITHTGRYADVYEDLVFYLKQLDCPIIILDEAGDLDYTAFLELKALWNATEYACGWYMMGADGLREKINRQKNLNKVGYTEIFDRYGNDFKKVSPEGKEALEDFYLKQIAQVSQANQSNLTPKQMYAKTKGSLRKVRIEIEKQRLLSNG
ncbi:ATP-binding protein [Riemerella anatipestifer]|uniref:ATP-binding protein n=1 Tax=Riemerella anatipestifer TaxID=34085 RepID=A0AAP3EZ04_RIEAN|nr:ATP-binding protein [Riemerella anatipestifer]AZZ59179.1 ATP-binding protein [Riemerella anatipestifer]MBT0573757.1 ATP-binding protein [Riemerella anatipestifer]MCU7568025.1 ATP-binding protein [Riemerella anatipestifer]MCW0490046.1 ATP-binding protein [Riemerella anatipestifer]MCW0510681.1 ATP-binding protein [Riemerella anatipestifer]